MKKHFSTQQHDGYYYHSHTVLQWCCMSTAIFLQENSTLPLLALPCVLKHLMDCMHITAKNWFISKSVSFCTDLETLYTFAHFLGNSCALLGNEPKFPNLGNLLFMASLQESTQLGNRLCFCWTVHCSCTVTHD